MVQNKDLQTTQIDGQSTLSLESEPADSSNQNTHLTRNETRQIVTPYAFFVADDLLGTPLAGPFRRGFGMLIDLFFLSLLTQVSSLVLAAVAAWTFFRASNRLKTKKRFNGARIALRFLVALLLFVVAIGIFDELRDDNSENATTLDIAISHNNDVDGIELVALTAKYLLDTKSMKQQIAKGTCAPAYDCLKTLGEELVQDIVASGLDDDTITGILEGYIGDVSERINIAEKQQLQNHLHQFAKTARAAHPLEKVDSPKVVDMISERSTDEIETDDPKGVLDWLKSLAEDLGLGVGWAAFYFSIFTAWWKGQTPGKKLMGTKVLKLDGTPLNLWESFGRYGGYAAGLATGLLGFLQVFWDPNRQAIQDKISETLVINVCKPKVSFSKKMAE